MYLKLIENFRDKAMLPWNPFMLTSVSDISINVEFFWNTQQVEVFCLGSSDLDHVELYIL